MTLAAVVMMLFVIWYMLDLQRQINQVEDFVRMLHTDFAEVVYKRYVAEKEDSEHNLTE